MTADTERVYVSSEHLADLAREYVAADDHDKPAVADRLVSAVFKYQAQCDGYAIDAYVATRDRAQAAIDRLADAHGTGRAT